MNTHINKCRTIRAAALAKHFSEHFSPVDFDHMPREVATEMLCAPKAKMTNRERKECQRARELRFESTREKKPVTTKMANRFFGASLAQLGKWNHRAVTRRHDVQCLYQHLGRQLEKLKGLKETPVTKAAAGMAEFRRSQLDLVAAQHELVSDLTANEINRRMACAALPARL